AQVLHAAVELLRQVSGVEGVGVERVRQQVATRAQVFGNRVEAGFAAVCDQFERRVGGEPFAQRLGLLRQRRRRLTRQRDQQQARSRAFAELVDQQLLRRRLRVRHEPAQVARELQVPAQPPAGEQQQRQPQEREGEPGARAHPLASPLHSAARALADDTLVALCAAPASRVRWIAPSPAGRRSMQRSSAPRPCSTSCSTRFASAGFLGSRCSCQCSRLPSLRTSYWRRRRVASPESSAPKVACSPASSGTRASENLRGDCPARSITASPAWMVVVSAYGARTSRTRVAVSGRRYTPLTRSGALSRRESRSSTNGVSLGTGRASRARIQSASIVSGAACRGAPAKPAASSSIVA